MATLPSNARAQEDEAEARALFDAATHACAGERWDDCADYFRRSLALVPRSATRLNLGLTLSRAGRIVDAAEAIRPLLEDPDATEAQRERARTELASLTARIGQIRVSVVGAPAAFVTIAGVSVGAIEAGHSIERDVEIGECEVVAVLADNERIRRVLHVSPGELVEAVIDFTPRRAQTVPVVPVVPTDDAGDDTGLFVGVGLLIAAVVAGALTGVFLYLDAQPQRNDAFGRIEALGIRF